MPAAFTILKPPGDFKCKVLDGVDVKTIENAVQRYPHTKINSLIPTKGAKEIEKLYHEEFGTSLNMDHHWLSAVNEKVVFKQCPVIVYVVCEIKSSVTTPTISISASGSDQDTIETNSYVVCHHETTIKAENGDAGLIVVSLVDS